MVTNDIGLAGVLSENFARCWTLDYPNCTKYDFRFPMGLLYWTRIKHQLRLWTLLYTRTLRWHTHTKKGTGNKLNRNQFQYVVNIHAANPTLAYSGKTFTLSIQLFRERLSDKSLTVHATIPKGIVGCFSPWLLTEVFQGNLRKCLCIDEAAWVWWIYFFLFDFCTLWLVNAIKPIIFIS